MKTGYAVKYRAVSVDRSVWSEALLFQQLPVRTRISNLSAPQHHAPSSTRRPLADQLRRNSAFWPRVCGAGWVWGVCQPWRTVAAVRAQAAVLQGPGNSFQRAPCPRLIDQFAVHDGGSLTFRSPQVPLPGLEMAKAHDYCCWDRSSLDSTL